MRPPGALQPVKQVSRFPPSESKRLNLVYSAQVSTYCRSCMRRVYFYRTLADSRYRIASTFAAGVAGGIVSKTGRYWYIIVLAPCLSAIGAGLLFTVKADTSTAKLIGFQILYGRSQILPPSDVSHLAHAILLHYARCRTGNDPSAAHHCRASYCQITCRYPSEDRHRHRRIDFATHGEVY